MTTLLRPSSRQIARVALSSLRATSKIDVRTARIQRPVPVSSSATYLLRRSRCYSNRPKPPPEKQPKRKDDEGESKEDAHKGEAPPEHRLRPPQLPEGWVRLTEEEIQYFATQFQNIPEWFRPQLGELIVMLREGGAPRELRDLILKGKTKGHDIGDLMSAIKIATKVSSMYARIHSEDLFPSQLEARKFYEDRRRVHEQHKAEQQKDEKQRNKQRKDEQQEDEQQNNERQKEEQKTQEQHQQQNEQRHGQEQGRSQKQGKSNTNPKQQKVHVLYLNEVTTYVVSAIISYYLYKVIFGADSRDITWQELRRNYLDKGLVEKLVVFQDRVRVDLNGEAVQAMYPDTIAGRPGFHFYFSIGSVESFERRLDEAQNELGIPSTERIPVTYEREGMMTSLILSFAPTLLFVGLLYALSRRAAGGMGGGSGGMFGFGKSKAKLFNRETAIKVNFSDIAGMDEAKVEIMEFVSFLKKPERFQKLGAKIPRGAILSGPPGTGKTLLAKATAGESGVPFFSCSGSEFVEMFVGVGPSRVRDLFANARKSAPCIIFIDEIDAIGRSRSDGHRFGGNEERESTLNQILTEMDGFNTSDQVVVLAGTNRPDVLDKALMRPGRFDRQIHIDQPTMKGRADIFKVHLGKIVTKEEMTHLCGRLAALTPGFSGADIANAVNEAALVAARENADSVAMSHFEKAIERVIGGLERKSLILNPQERRTVAYHEAGHAICGWYFEFADPLLKVSIIPRGHGALGYAQYLPVGDAYLLNTKQLMDRMAMTLGGRVSEELHFPSVTTGASDDFKKVTAMATSMVTKWGMSDTLGPIHFDNDRNQFNKPFAEDTAMRIDGEVKRIVDRAYKQCKALLDAKRKEIGIVAEELLKKEMLTRDDLVRLLGPRPFPDREEFTKYFDGSHPSQPPPNAGTLDDPPAQSPAFKEPGDR